MMNATNIDWKKYVWTGIFVVLFLSACGYRFSGTGNLPSGIQTVAVDVLKNRTSETGFESTMTNDLIFEFIRRGRTVEKNPQKADAVLSGVIKSSSVSTIARQAQQSAVARQVRVTISLKLTGKDGRVIWSAPDISDYEAYQVTSSREATENNKRRALESVAKRIAEKAYNRMTDNF